MARTLAVPHYTDVRFAVENMSSPGNPRFCIILTGDLVEAHYYHRPSGRRASYQQIPGRPAALGMNCPRLPSCPKIVRRYSGFCRRVAGLYT